MGKNNTLVAIGTEDSELFCTRTKTHSLESYSATLNENTIKIEVNKFNQNYPLSMYFGVAWNSLSEETESSCNFAVDVPHARILKGKL